MATPLHDQEVERLDELIALLASSPAEEARLVEERAVSARVYKLGAMPVEYEATLEMARKAAARIPDRETKERAKDLLERVISAHRAS